MRKVSILLICLILISFTSCKKKADLVDEIPKTDASTIEQTDTTVQDVAGDDIDSSFIDSEALGSQDNLEGDKLNAGQKGDMLEDVYFGFDKSALTSEAREILAQHSRWLKEHPGQKIIIEGHCDERGTEQYNIALGDRRANSVKNYLVSLGVSSSRMITQSYGELYPKVNESNEWAWSQNRRAHFVIKER